MKANAQLAQQLQNWIAAQLAAGKSEQALIDMMIAQQVAPAMAIHTMRQYKALQGRAVSESPAAYDYEMPRLPPLQTLRVQEREIPVVARILRPRISVFDHVLDTAECEQLIRYATPLLQPTDTAGIERATLPRALDGFIVMLEQRLAELMHAPPEQAEAFEIRRYRHGAAEPAQHDFLSAHQANSSSGGQRVASLLIYLNEAAEGGAIVFPEVGVETPPKTGAAVYVDYCNSKRQLDQLSRRAVNAVSQGEQWLLIRHLREQPLAPLSAYAEVN